MDYGFKRNFQTDIPNVSQYTLWCHQTWQAGKSPLRENHRTKPPIWGSNRQAMMTPEGYRNSWVKYQRNGTAYRRCRAPGFDVQRSKGMQQGDTRWTWGLIWIKSCKMREFGVELQLGTRGKVIISRWLCQKNSPFWRSIKTVFIVQRFLQPSGNQTWQQRIAGFEYHLVI